MRHAHAFWREFLPLVYLKYFYIFFFKCRAFGCSMKFWVVSISRVVLFLVMNSDTATGDEKSGRKRLIFVRNVHASEAVTLCPLSYTPHLSFCAWQLSLVCYVISSSKKCRRVWDMWNFRRRNKVTAGERVRSGPCSKSESRWPVISKSRGKTSREKELIKE